MNFRTAFLLIILFTSSDVFASGRDIQEILRAYGYVNSSSDFKAMKAVSTSEAEAECYDCNPYRDPWGGQFYKTGIWGRDDRRPLEVDESTLPRELRLTRNEKHQLKAVGKVECYYDGDIQYGTGFIVNIDKYSYNKNRNYDIIASASHVLFNPKNGEARKCYYVEKYEGKEEYYDLEVLSCGSKKPETITNGINDKDWCFTKVSKRLSKTFGSLEVEFSDKFNWSNEEQDRSKWITGGYRLDKDRVEFSLDCAPDDKRKYSNFDNDGRQWGYDLSRVVIGDCDQVAGASGGPLIERVGNKLKIQALITGDLNENNIGSYKPNTGHAGRFTKFTLEMEKKLKEIILSLEAI